jgi:putative lipoic acid-binding regulatory protein
MTATSLPSPLTFPKFHQFTPEMAGASRAHLFTQLPEQMQKQAWDDLAERTRGRLDRLWEEER